ncbi:MAG: hypothetical protein PF590_01090 [Candidatus Delongbacteria bacterium]|nr:hypothetical protein [Candidatus Delongbacteria bacterium]
MACILPVVGQVTKKNTYNTHYDVGIIPGGDAFMILTEKEKELDSLFRQIAQVSASMPGEDSVAQNSQLKRMDFKNNRSRVSMEIYRNGEIRASDSLLKQGFPTTCTCIMMNDTIFVKSFIGFFSGMGIDVNITDGEFQSGFFVYADDAMPYKSNISDTVFHRSLDPGAKYQYLVLDKQPQFQKGHQLTGLLTITTDEFYEQNNQGNIDRISLKGKIYFTCKVNIFSEQYR